MLTAAQDRLFDVHVNFKTNSSKLLEISFERQEAFSVLDQSELGASGVKKYQCALKQDGSDLGHFVQNGANDVVPFTIIRYHDICQPMQNLSIRCEIGLYFHENVNVKSREFSYEGSGEFLNYRCDMNIFYAITIGNNHIFKIKASINQSIYISGFLQAYC